MIARIRIGQTHVAKALACCLVGLVLEACGSSSHAEKSPTDCSHFLAADRQSQLSALEEFLTTDPYSKPFASLADAAQTANQILADAVAACNRASGSTSLSEAAAPYAPGTETPSDSTTDAAQPPSATTTAPAGGAPSSPYIAVLSTPRGLVGPSDNTPVLAFFDPADGRAISVEQVPALTGTTNFQPIELGGTSGLFSFNGDLTEVAGTDTGTGAPAYLTLASGDVTDVATPPSNSGFDATFTPQFVGESFNPKSNDFWYAVTSGPPNSDSGGQPIEIVGPGYKKTTSYVPNSNGPTPSDVVFYWALGHDLPTVDANGAYLSLPNGHWTTTPAADVPPIVDPTTLAATKYSVGTIRLADNEKAAAFVGESPQGRLSLFTVPATGGEPTLITADVPLSLPKFNEDADQPIVERYVAS